MVLELTNTYELDEDFYEDVAATLQEGGFLVGGHAGLHALNDELQFSSGDHFQVFGVIEVFLLEQERRHLCNLNDNPVSYRIISTGHGQQQRIDKLLKVGVGQPIDIGLGLGPSLVVVGQQHFDDSVEITIHLINYLREVHVALIHAISR